LFSTNGKRFCLVLCFSLDYQKTPRHGTLIAPSGPTSD
jgi:hypothetical protein